MRQWQCASSFIYSPITAIKSLSLSDFLHRCLYLHLLLLSPLVHSLDPQAHASWIPAHALCLCIILSVNEICYSPPSTSWWIFAHLDLAGRPLPWVLFPRPSSSAWQRVRQISTPLKVLRLLSLSCWVHGAGPLFLPLHFSIYSLYLPLGFLLLNWFHLMIWVDFSTSTVDWADQETLGYSGEVLCCCSSSLIWKPQLLLVSCRPSSSPSASWWLPKLKL